MHTNAENFAKIVQTSRPLRDKFIAKIRNFDYFGAVFPHFCPDKGEIWHGERIFGPKFCLC